MWIALQVVAGLITTLVVCFAAWFFLSKGGKRTRALLNLPATPAGKLIEGKRTKIVGRVVLSPGTPLLAPVSQQPVAAYQAYLAFSSPGLSPRHIPLRAVASFLVETSNGSVLVEASDAVFNLPMGDAVRVPWADALPWMDELVTRDGLHFDRSAPRAQRVGCYDMAQAVIAAGTQIAVLGVAGRNADGVVVLQPDPTLGMALSIDAGLPPAT